MRGIAYALLASGALALGAMSPATAGCYGDDCGYRERPSVSYYESAPRTYERYGERSYYREFAPSHRTRHYDRPSYYDRPTYHDRPTYYDRPAYHDRPTYYDRPTHYVRPSCYERPSCYDRPAVTTTYYDGGSYERPSYSSYYRPYYRKYYSSSPYSYRPHYRTLRYGGGWTQTGYGRGYAYGGCHTAYIPYGWTWYRARNC